MQQIEEEEREISSLQRSKFHPLWGTDLKVGFKTIVPKSVAFELDAEKYDGLVRDDPYESVRLVYEPAVYATEPGTVVFSPADIGRAWGQKLEFRRKKKKDKNEPRLWMVGGRHGEESDFGFSSRNASRSLFYLPLAFPTRRPDGSTDGTFVPMYVKVQDLGRRLLYVMITAERDGSEVVVSCSEVLEAEAPEVLRLVRP